MLIEKLEAFIAQASEEIYKVLTEDKKEDKTPPLPPPSEICGLIDPHRTEPIKCKLKSKSKTEVIKIHEEGQFESKIGKDKDRVVIKI